MSVCEAGLDVFWFEPGVPFEYGFRRITGGEHPKHVFDGQPPAADDRLPGENRRVYRNSFEKRLFVHAESIDPATPSAVPVSDADPIFPETCSENQRKEPTAP
jgi:hypothetical protein